MMDRLPRLIRPLKLAEAGARLQGWLPLSEMSRLAARLVASEARVESQLEFGIDAGHTRFIRGRIKARLPMICQRCLGQMQFPVDIDVSLGIIGAGKKAERLAATYEPLLLTAETGELADIIEDELLLVLPIVAMHPPGKCIPGVQDEVIVQAPQARQPEETRRPFADLATLMKPKPH